LNIDMNKRLSITLLFLGYLSLVPCSSATTLVLNPSVTSNISTNNPQVGQWDKFEETIVNSKSYKDPYNDVSLEVTYTGPNGRVVKFSGFYDGGNTWKIRFMPDNTGLWKYQAKFSDGSTRKSGTFTCIPSSIPGMISRDEMNPIWFGYKGGKHVLIRSFHVGDRFFASNWPSENRKAFLDWVGDQGYNMLSIASHYLNRNSAGRGRGHDTPKLWPLNHTEYQKMELLLEDLAKRRIMVYPFAGFMGRNSNFPKEPADQTKYLRYTIARLGAYWHVLFNVSGPEPLLGHNSFLTKEEVNRLGEEIAQLDPFGHLLSCHNETGNDVFKDFSWVSYGIVQGGKTTNLAELSKYLLSNHHPQKALYAQETFWPGNKNMPLYTDHDLRRVAYVMNMSAAAINYGDMNGTSSSGFSDSMNLGDRKQNRHTIVKMVWDFFDTIPFYRMSPRQDLTSNGFCLASPGNHYLVYLPEGGSVDINVNGGPFNVQWIDATKPNEKRSGGKTSNGRGLTAPGDGDWLVYLTK
jgi:hypothetical protein